MNAGWPEFTHSVDIVEGVRSPENRKNLIPMAIWTKHSRESDAKIALLSRYFLSCYLIT
jgi:hypothetical protein